MMLKLIDEIQTGFSDEEIEVLIAGMKKIQKNIKTEEFVAIETK